MAAKFSWPSAGKRLFGSNRSDCINNACLNYGQQLYGYREGYKRAGLILTNHVVETGNDQDVLLYPIVFCYRHHTELMLKEMLQLAQALLDDDTPLPLHHRLKDLWAKAKGLLRKIYNAELEADFKKADEHIDQFLEVDPKGESFRFSVATDGSPTLASLKLINVRTFAEAMEDLSLFLDCGLMDLGEKLSWKREMEREMQMENQR